MSDLVNTEIGYIPPHWQVSKIGEIGDVTKLAGYEYTKYFKYVEDGEVVALRALNVRDGVLDLNDVKRIYRNVSDELPRSKLFTNDILFTYVGANIGQFALVPENEKYHLAPNICRIRCNEGFIPYFLYSYFRTYQFKKLLEGYVNGSSQGTLPMGNIRLLSIPNPPIEEQKQIAKTLSNLDQKITLLREQNQTLEELAQTLFKRWFVEFEFPNENGQPYKSSGGNMVDSELGEIPEGWSVGRFQDIASVKGRIGWRGYTHKDLVEKGPLVIGGRDIDGVFISLDKVQHITRFKYDESPEIQLEDLDIILSKTGTIGPAALFDKKLLGEATINPNVALVRANKGLAEFAYTLLKLPSTQHYLKSHTTSSVQPAVNQENIRIMPIALPENEKLVEMSKIFIPTYKKMINNNREIQSLTQLRDTLLPKLMSGELRVNF